MTGLRPPVASARLEPGTCEAGVLEGSEPREATQWTSNSELEF